MRTHHTAALLATTALLALTGCAGDPAPAKTGAAPAPASSTPPKADPVRAGLEKAVRAYSAAYFKPDGAAAYATLSKRCATKAGDAELFAGIVDTAAKAYGAQEIQTLTIDQLAGDMARVSYTYSVPKLNQTSQPWAREGGAWKYDGC
ncbi:hypothetical protein BCL76_11535 [Streptomyces sp. CG 926]|uniref:hypothetical protein n=1 Tax=Streptomyces sp. CG 926 TaxID=1882405 RepID=UPI000D7A6D19|nr:hypothetical protein [Streptomyces sp. CG 926]PWK64391.1 hypothetical protein BCL76_11535 [Streptomyces sp. CG 926]